MDQGQNFVFFRILIIYFSPRLIKAVTFVRVCVFLCLRGKSSALEKGGVALSQLGPSGQMIHSNGG